MVTMSLNSGKFVIYDQNIFRSILKTLTYSRPNPVLSLHTALPVRRPPLTPHLCLPTSYIYCSLYNKKKHQFPKFSMWTRSLAHGEPKMADGFHFDYRLKPRPSTMRSKPMYYVAMSFKRSQRTNSTCFQANFSRLIQRCSRKFCQTFENYVFLTVFN